MYKVLSSAISVVVHDIIIVLSPQKPTWGLLKSIKNNSTAYLLEYTIF